MLLWDSTKRPKLGIPVLIFRENICQDLIKRVNESFQLARPVNLTHEINLAGSFVMGPEGLSDLNDI